jgi:DNA uptake protein ComE-like DNA-binding protein
MYLRAFCLSERKPQGEIMDLRVFFQKVRAAEAKLTTPHVVVVSLETPDGGKAGVKTEAAREIAAKLLVEGRARLATPEEAADFKEAIQAAIKEREREEASKKVNFNVVSDEELKTLRRIRKDQ